MLHLSPSARYFYYSGFADMRKGAYSLNGLVRNEIEDSGLFAIRCSAEGLVCSGISIGA